MFFRNTVRYERASKFEQWQQATDEALRRPGVQRELGQLGFKLIELNRTAFLPNVRHREVSVPRRYLNTNHVGILPYLESDDDLQSHETLLQPTPARRERIQTALGQAGLDTSYHALLEFIRRTTGQISEEERTAFVNPISDVIASSGALSHYDDNTEILVTGRPLVRPNWREIPPHQILQGAVGAHELVHALDTEELLTEPDILYRAQTELRGYRVSAVIIEDALEKHHLSRWLLERYDTITMEVEEVRQIHKIDADALLNGGLRITDDNDSVALYLMLMNVVD